MSDYELIQQAKASAGVETGPRSKGYVNPRHVVEEPVEVEQVAEPVDGQRVSTSTRPIPVDHTANPTPTGGSGSPLATDPGPSVQELADRAWRRQYG